MTEKNHKIFLQESQADPNSQTFNSLQSKTLNIEPKVTKKSKTSEKVKIIEENSPSQKEIQTKDENNKISFLKPPNLIEKNLKNPKLNKNSKNKSRVFLQNFLESSNNRMEADKEDNNHNLDDSEDSEDNVTKPLTTISDEDDIENMQKNLKRRKQNIVREIQKIKENFANNEDKKNLENVENFEKKIESLEEELQNINKQNLDLKEKIQKADYSENKELTMERIKQKLQKAKKKMYILKIKHNLLKTSHKIQGEEITDLIKFAEEDKKDRLDCDSYLFTSVLLEYFIAFMFYFFFIYIMTVLSCFFLILSPIIDIFRIIFRIHATDFQDLKRHWLEIFSGLLELLFFDFINLGILLFFIILLTPGILVIVTQILCIIQLSQDDSTGVDMSYMMTLKTLIIIFFFFISMREASSAFDVIGYFYMKAWGRDKNIQKKLDEELEKQSTYIKSEEYERFRQEIENKRSDRLQTFIIFIIRIFPQIMQIFVCFLISYINIYLIGQVDNSIDLIQNFAALAILLEFDNFIMSFLRYVRFFTLYKKFLEKLDVGVEEKTIRKKEKADRKKEIQKLQDLIQYYKQSLRDYRKNKGHRPSLDGSPLKHQETGLEDLKKHIGQLKQKKGGSNRRKSQMVENVQEAQTEKKNFFDFLKKLKRVNPLNVIQYLGSIDSVRILLSKKDFPVEKEFRLLGEVKETLNLIGLMVMTTGITLILIYYIS